MRALGWIVAVAVLALIIVSFALRETPVGVARTAYHALGFGGPGLVQPGQALPKLTYVSLDGVPAALAPAPGRITFVNVFATWCPPCQAEAPALSSFARTGRAQGIDVIGVDQQESADAVRRFRAAYHADYPMLIDMGWTSKDVLGARDIPRSVVVDAHGIVRAAFTGPMTLEQMRGLAARAASGL
jgi:thiol-disulfide isomerase/thioredoxin